MTYGERLRWARDRAGLTQPELARISGVKQVSISKIERDEQTGSSFDAVLARYLSVVSGVNLSPDENVLNQILLS